MSLKNVAHDGGPRESVISRLRSRLQRARYRFARTTDRIARTADPWCRTWLAISVAALIVGVVPVLVAAVVRSSAHQIISALALAPLVWSCARSQHWAQGMALMAATFLWHSLTMIAVTASAPNVASDLIPGGDAYWTKQYVWITTGSDPEYEWKAWGPAHAQLFCGTTLFSLTSLGTITLHQGFYEVDLMNYYNGRLIRISRRPAVALLYGWHLWSLLRGCGYVVLTYELISLGLQLVIGRSLSTWQCRCIRWSAGIGFLILDAATKWYLLDTVRQQLALNLISP